MPAISIMISVISIDRLNDVVELVRALSIQTDYDTEIVVIVGKDKNLFHGINFALSNVKNVRTYYNPGPWSLSAQRNFSIPCLNGDYVAFLDDDVLPCPTWIKEVVNTFSYSSVIGMTGPVEPLWAGREPLIPSEISWVISCTSWTGLVRMQRIAYTWGGNMAFRRIVFDIGLRFNEHMGLGSLDSFLIGEDSEFGLKVARETLGSIIWNPRAIVFHKIKSYRITASYLVRRAFSVGYTQAQIRQSFGKTSVTLGQSSAMMAIVKGVLKRIIRRNENVFIKLRDNGSIFVVLVSLALGSATWYANRNRLASLFFGK